MTNQGRRGRGHREHTRVVKQVSLEQLKCVPVRTHAHTRAEAPRSFGRRSVLWQESRNGSDAEKKEGEF